MIDGPKGALATVLMAVLGRLYMELKTVPVTLCSIVFLGVIVLWMAHDHVSIEQFSGISIQVSSVQYTMNHDHLDSRHHAIDAEIFTLSQHVLDEKTQGHVIDRLYLQRLEDLQRQREEILRQLDLLERRT